jgi:hypothetical protein
METIDELRLAGQVVGLHYSTASSGEVKQALARVAKIATAGAKVIDISTARRGSGR